MWYFSRWFECCYANNRIAIIVCHWPFNSNFVLLHEISMHILLFCIFTEKGKWLLEFEMTTTTTTMILMKWLENDCCWIWVNWLNLNCVCWMGAILHFQLLVFESVPNGGPLLMFRSLFTYHTCHMDYTIGFNGRILQVNVIISFSSCAVTI